MGIFDSSADEIITERIRELDRELNHTRVSDDDFVPLVEAIAKLRVSMSPTIIEHKEK